MRIMDMAPGDLFVLRGDPRTVYTRGDSEADGKSPETITAVLWHTGEAWRLIRAETRIMPHWEVARRVTIEPC